MCLSPKVPKIDNSQFKVPLPPPPPPPPEKTAKRPKEPTTRTDLKKSGKQALRFDVGGTSGISGINFPGA